MTNKPTPSTNTEAVSDELSFSTLREANVARQRDWCPDQLPDLSFRGNELAGETGEVCNVIKKLERERLGWRGSRDTIEHLAEELGDVVICADLIAISAGIDLDAAVEAKFNATSEKVGLPHRLSRRSASNAGGVEVKWQAIHADDSSPVERIAYDLAVELEQADLDRHDFVTVNRAKLTAIAERVWARAIASRNRNAEVGVKALEWKWVDPSGIGDAEWLEAWTPFGPYQVSHKPTHTLRWMLEPFRSDLDSNYATEAEAKAAAQADFNQRILSSLAAEAEPVAGPCRELRVWANEVLAAQDRRPGDVRAMENAILGLRGAYESAFTHPSSPVSAEVTVTYEPKYVPHEVALAGFYEAQKPEVKAKPLYDQCCAIYQAMRAASINGGRENG